MTDTSIIIVLGTGGLFTYGVIKTLIDRQVVPKCYIQAGQRDINDRGIFDNFELEVNRATEPLGSMLKHKSVPFIYEADISLADYLDGLTFDYLLVACWPGLLSEDILGKADKAAVNLHPSLLPRFRGINPIGDQLKHGDNEFGITLHLMNQQFDRGKIVLQQTLDTSNSDSQQTIETLAAEVGAALFIQAMETFHQPGWNLKEQGS